MIYIDHPLFCLLAIVGLFLSLFSFTFFMRGPDSVFFAEGVGLGWTEGFFFG
jgi:hypothetical protein